MFNVTRRQALAASGGLVGAMLAPKRFASAAGNTLNIAYNVNLPSFDPDVGPSSVIRRSRRSIARSSTSTSARSRTSRSNPAC
jgi:hypothetical protein